MAKSTKHPTSLAFSKQRSPTQERMLQIVPILKPTATASASTSSKRSSLSPINTPINMFSTDLEKGAGAHTSSSFGPNTSSNSAPADFPPKYESQVNYEMQRIGEAQPQAPKIVDIDYDTLAPSRKQSKRPIWFWVVIACAIVTMIIGAVIIAVNVANHKQKQESQASPSSLLPVAESQANTTQSPVLTRSEPNASRALMTTSPDVVTVTAEPMTSLVYVTVTPPTPSTSTVVVSPSEPTSISTPVVTITLTSTSTSSTSTSLATSSTVTTVVPFDAPVTASPGPTITSVSTANLSEIAAESSIQAELSQISERLIASPITQTVVSMTTETASVSRIPIVSTATGVLYRCTAPGMACGK